MSRFSKLLAAALVCAATMACLCGFAVPDSKAPTSVRLTAENCGIELVMTDQPFFSYEYLGVADTSRFSVRIQRRGNLVVVDASGPSAFANLSIKTEPEYSNTVRIYVPDMAYERFAIGCTQAPLTMPDIDGEIVVEANRGTVIVRDVLIQKGQYTIRSTAGSIHVEADALTADMALTNTQGGIDLQLHAQTGELFLDVIDIAAGKPVRSSSPNVYGKGPVRLEMNSGGTVSVSLSAIK